MLPTPQGWFPDPADATRLRYWDGWRWTDHVAVADRRAAPHPTLPLKAALGAIGVLLVSLIGSRYVLKALTARVHWPIVFYLGLLAVIGYGPSLWWCRRAVRRAGYANMRNGIGLEFKGIDFGWGPLTWLSCIAAQLVVALIVVLTKIPFTSNTTDVTKLRADHGYVVSMLVIAVAAAPFVEEIVFRGVVLRGLLSRVGVPAAVAIQGVLFGAAHFDPVRGAGNIGLVMVLSAVGVVLGGAAYLVRRLGPTMFSHAITNAVAMTIALSGWAPKR